MTTYQCKECDKSFLNGVDLSYHIETLHGSIPTMTEAKCPQCESQKVVFIAKGFKDGKENHQIYYCPPCKRALKIESI